MVDLVFIDPPYNTGNEGWCYNDNVNAPMIKEWLDSNPIGIADEVMGVPGWLVGLVLPQVGDEKDIAGVLDDVDLAVLLADADGRIDWTNQAFQRLSGYTNQELENEGGSLDATATFLAKPFSSQQLLEAVHTLLH